MDDVRRLERLCYSENTWKTRNVQLKRYNEFCEQYVLEPFPLVSLNMRKYVAHLAKDLVYASIQQYLSAILVLSRMMGYKDETRDTLGLQWILGGVKRLKGDVVTSSTGLYPENLLAMKAFLNLGNIVDLVFWVACLIMLRTLLRGSNVLDSGFCMKFDDVKVLDWGVVFTIGRTKTIQFKQRVLEIPVAKVIGHELCMVKYLVLLLKYSGTGPGLPLLGWLEKGKFVPAKYDWFMKKLKSLCGKLNLEGKFGTHSFRHGGASTLSMLGMDLPGISKRGDWKSLCVLRYVNRPLSNTIKEELVWSKKILDFVL